MYQNFQRVIENANVIISTYECDDMGESQQVDPCKGTVAFGSALFGWAFTLTRFARIYAEKFKVDFEKMMQKLWGDNFFDAKNKKWTTEENAEDGTQLKRCFVQFIMEPIIKLCKNIMDGNKDAVFKMLTHLEIVLKPEEKEKVGKDLFKCVF
jgi:elongation factor 2